MRPITWAFNGAVVLGVLLSVTGTGAAPSAAERALNGTEIIDEVAREAVASPTLVATPTATTASPGKSVVSSQSSVKSSVSPSVERSFEFEPSTQSVHIGESRGTPNAREVLPDPANDEENMVMSEQDSRRLKPNQKKIDQQQHRLNVEKVIDETQFDFEHYFDTIPSSFAKEPEDTSKTDSPLDRRNAQQSPPPVFEVTDPSVLQKILDFLGLEDFLVEQHLREAHRSMNDTLSSHVKNDDDVLIVKSVKVNVRKV